LSELNGLFKYIDENYSEEFNEEYFVLAQMSTAFKMLGTMIVEEFKKVREEGRVGDGGGRKETEKRGTLGRKVKEEIKGGRGNGGNRFKRSITRKGTTRASRA
jgi:hypothetical protein